MRLSCLLVPTLVVLSSAAMTTLAEAADFAIKEDPGKHIDVCYKDRVMLRLMTANDTSDAKTAHETYKVYAHVMDPTDAENERTLTKGAGSQYTHHRGIFIGFSKANIDGVGGVDTWHMKDGVRQQFGEIVQQETDDDKATLTVTVDWVKDDQPLMSEERTFVVHEPEDNGAVLIDTSSKITATVGDAVLKGDPEHAGLQYRAHEDVVQNKSARYLFPEGAKPGNGGTKDMPWAAMTYQAHGNNYYVQHMSHPSLPKGNVYSAYRNYGRFGAYFVKELANGESATFKVRLYVSPGAFPDGAVTEMNKRYKDYVARVK
jgi:hypothetical protein